jgi:fructuronate reductase
MKMVLKDNGLNHSTVWKKGGFRLPKFDREKMISATRKNPVWIHFGLRNRHSIFPAVLMQRILDKKHAEQGLFVCEAPDAGIAGTDSIPYDDVSLHITSDSNGKFIKTVIASVAGCYRCCQTDTDDWEELKKIFCRKSLQIVSFTIDRDKYEIKDSYGNYKPEYLPDFEAGPSGAELFISRLCALLYERYLHGEQQPVALVSLDDCAQNGIKLHSEEKLQQAVYCVVSEWVKRELVEDGFWLYVISPNLVSYPWSITDTLLLSEKNIPEHFYSDGLNHADGAVTEETYYFVIEDTFPNGRPPLELAGVCFTDRETVSKVERMEKCMCLVPLYGALAVFGCLFGYENIADEMNDGLLNTLVHRLAYQEELPVTVNPEIIEPKRYVKEVLDVRLPNKLVSNTPQQVFADMSQHMSAYFGESIKEYYTERKIPELKYIPLVLAVWCRCLVGIDDNGVPFDISAFPVPEKARTLASVQFNSGNTGCVIPEAYLFPLLSDVSVFGIDLYTCGLARRVVQYFTECISGPGAVRTILQKYLQ